VAPIRRHGQHDVIGIEPALDDHGNIYVSVGNRVVKLVVK
jgi:hypothetical protein